MNLFRNVFRPGATAHAHCDGPCGVYDPASARIAAEAVLSMEKKIAALGDGHALRREHVTRSHLHQGTAGGSLQARARHPLDRLLQAGAPRRSTRPETFWKAASFCSKNKTEQDPANGEALLQAVEEYPHDVLGFEARTCPFIRAS